MNDPKAQIVEKLKSSGNILIAVSANPSVDQLAALIALTLLLNKYKKNATAVFSGKVPQFLNFLHPAENMQKNTDSLRDFIIALDKSKADKLRYKVEDDVVKIFITPYRTSITEKDLKYSAGEFNVDLIIAVGVHHQQDLDTAITAHGRIFHDAVVMSINNTPGGDFGVANWEDVGASSLSELIADLIEAIDPHLMDTDIATALLTGIVAETGRFSNEKTHPRTMTVSSKLLEAGANQQLVNTQLQDLIGTVVNLAAGTEIKPTADLSNEPLAHNDVADELVIDETGNIATPGMAQSDDTPLAKQGNAPADKPAGDNTKPAADDAAKTDNKQPEPIKVETPDLVLPNTPEVAPPSAQPATDDTHAANDALASIESMLGQPLESTPAPAVDAAKQAAPASGTAAPAMDADAKAARQAIEDALVSPAPKPAPAPAAGPTPPAQPGTPAQPTPAAVPAPNPAGSPANERAPLSMSPADQPFTMPMPAPGTAPAAAPPIGQASPLQPQAGPTPPPLPPPMTPPAQ